MCSQYLEADWIQIVVISHLECPRVLHYSLEMCFANAVSEAAAYGFVFIQPVTFLSFRSVLETEEILMKPFSSVCSAKIQCHCTGLF